MAEGGGNALSGAGQRVGAYKSTWIPEPSRVLLRRIRCCPDLKPQKACETCLLLLSRAVGRLLNGCSAVRKRPRSTGVPIAFVRNWQAARQRHLSVDTR